ncbi:lariat debranching enzyme isoform X2 [Dendrobium catenatum]|uniref:lariat debranching enzyme isoform X2 n=1 Tax=Dendrobium catenatum TaxID=906689 RepID=UPI0009F2A3C8|nr:lariat debranching enzyme isoform X2 [Dendrobium catenatum]XP_020702335.1 lariat debranching enzyme isoform X2 [Dendrobium catenatum]XP_028549279.1 lariat debranching enzyme isoform X2 [Dendrobium catenatum]
MKIAVEGCMHGDLDKVYATLKRLEEAESTKIDLLLCCGDFQAVRNEEDLKSLNVPPKYRHMNSFWKYYSGQVKAPYPTIFIGGNHEASNYLWELYYGGWAAPNIYFLGFSGVIKFGNIRIGGLSGIYKSKDYYLGHHERPPYDDNNIRSVYHVRQYDVLKLMHVAEPIDIFLSHDWPLGITDYGNWEKLVQQKPYFKEEVRLKTLGSKPAAELLDKLKPPYWFSAHLHCRFPAIIQHGENGPITKFLALDKCLPGRRFLQIIEIKSDPGPPEIQYDEEWLAITRKFNNIFHLSREYLRLKSDHLDNQDSRYWVKNKLNVRGAKPFEFSQTVPSFDPNKPGSTVPSGHHRNPQTESFLQFLELPYLLDITDELSTPKRISEFSSPLVIHSQKHLDGEEDDDDAHGDDVDELEELAAYVNDTQ